MKRLAMILLCGWVLWTEIWAPSRPSVWEIASAYETKAECDSKAFGGVPRRAKFYEEQGYKVEMSGSKLTLRREGAVLTVDSLCLPGGTDPRPRFKE